jgi:hypothetical protein
MDISLKPQNKYTHDIFQTSHLEPGNVPNVKASLLEALPTYKAK